MHRNKPPPGDLVSRRVFGGAGRLGTLPTVVPEDTLKTFPTQAIVNSEVRVHGPNAEAYSKLMT